MKKISPYLVVCLLLSFLSAGLAYLSCESLYVLIGVLASFLLVSFFYLLPRLNAYQDAKRRGHECYRFINAYLISLSATQSMERSFSSAMEGMEGRLLEIQNSLEGIDPYEKVRYLASYFSSPLYAMFLSILELYQTQGGDVLRLGASLLDETTRVEEAARSAEKSGAKSLFQYAVLWGMSLFIMAFLRFGLSSFYEKIANRPVYLACIAVFYAFFLGSIVIYVHLYTSGTRRERKERKHGKMGKAA